MLLHVSVIGIKTQYVIQTYWLQNWNLYAFENMKNVRPFFIVPQF